MVLRSILAALIAGAEHIAARECGVPQHPREIQIGLCSTGNGSAILRLAQEIGLNRKHGIFAKFVFYETVKAATLALVSGSEKFVLSELGEAIRAQTLGHNVGVILISGVPPVRSNIQSAIEIDLAGASSGKTVSESSICLQAMRGYAEENLNLVESVVAAISDTATEMEVRPLEVRDVLGRLYPDENADTLDRHFENELQIWRARQL